jgi:beta-glucosidase
MLLVGWVVLPAGAQQANVTGSRRVDRILSRMTLAEKIGMIHGTGEDAATNQGEAGYLPGVKRLGIPPMRFADGPPGVLTRVPSIAPTSTMGLAATFSVADARMTGALIAREARSHGVSVVLQPFINIDRDFASGRGYNTFGEDPFLTGQLAAAEIAAIQSRGVMSQAKHFIGYDTDATNVSIDSQTLHEVYLAPFAAAIGARVSSLMCSYNRIDGPYSCGNAATLKKLLREEDGFEGFVTSDWGATHGADFINAGLDMEMPGPLPVPWAGSSFFVHGPERRPTEGEPPDGLALTDAGLPEEPPRTPAASFPEPHPPDDLRALLASGVVSEETITRAAGRVLLQMEKFGYLDGKNKLRITPSDNAVELRIVEKTAIDAAVLLKNHDSALPLKPDDLQSLAMIGPGAGQTVAVGLTGEKAVGLPQIETGPLAELRKLAGQGAHVTYAVADDMDGAVVPARFLTHFGEAGLERRVWNQDAVNVDPEIDFTRAAHTALPANESIVWTGTLTAPESGTYRIHLQLLGCYGKLKLDDSLIHKNWFNWIHGEVIQAGQDNIFPTTGGLDNLRAAVHLDEGAHRIFIDVRPDGSDAPVQVRLSWVTPQQQRENYAAAVNAARKAKTAIVFAWSRTRPVFGLPGDQDKLIADVAAVNPNTIVVLNVSQPVSMPWLEQVKAVLDMGWPGDAGGTAAAKLLLGRENPGGRLPFTWPRRLEDTAANDPAFPERSNKGVDGKTTFSEGILVGYRWFDRRRIEPLFPFGFGLSFTTFGYSGMETSRANDGGIDVSLRITNTGPAAGDEVAQVYLATPPNPPANVQFADSMLAGFERIHLLPRQSALVVLHVPLRQLQYWSTAQDRWITAQGERTLWAGGSSRDRRLESRIEVK